MGKSESKTEAYTGEDIRSAREIFAELYEQYLPRVFRYISYRIGDVHLAEDLTSSVFEKALTGFRSYRSDKASFSTWLLSIAKYTLIDHYRVSGRGQIVPLEKANETSSENSPPEEEAVRREELQKLQICLAGLRQQEQEIISLKFGAELTNRQIARMLSLSESNVGTILYRAVRKLRDSFR
ncbi:RNA polymerase sigma factor YlaC [subsurface metagenome]